MGFSVEELCIWTFVGAYNATFVGVYNVAEWSTCGRVKVEVSGGKFVSRPCKLLGENAILKVIREKLTIT